MHKVLRLRNIRRMFAALTVEDPVGNPKSAITREQEEVLPNQAADAALADPGSSSSGGVDGVNAEKQKAGVVAEPVVEDDATTANLEKQ
ncbi:hypothetical protein PRZ48_011343 [Zasmidium cellare]|uniref:Uncharacterized protein n=1 Tax=Zasmidium cellare TaxID=395010 RepID=A0ABR0E633_ZASCE|nr:hypothetical protein PRZ48_011343 [Zasmidium cellare]